MATLRKFQRPWPAVALVALALVMVLGGCSQLQPGPTAASAEAARFGGGAVVVNGQIQEGIVVNGVGTSSADPDIAKVTFGVELQGQDPQALVSEAAEKMDAAMAAATGLGIVESETQTLNYSLWVETVHDPQTGRPTGEILYHLSHQVQVTTDSIDTVGELLAGIVNAGANAVSGVNFAVRDSATLVEQARDAALDQARVRAEAIASKLGVTLGAPLLVTESGGDVPVYDLAVGRGGLAEAASPSVTPGSFSVSVTMQVVYAIR